MRFSRRRTLLAAGLLAGVLTACTTQVTAPPPSPSPVADGHALDRFYDQKLAWGDCGAYATGQQSQDAFRTPGVECARLTVPLDYADPHGQTITVGVLRHRALDPANRIGSLVMNPGGPGGSGMEAAARLVPTVVNNAIGLRFDFVGFDPRGVGASEPRIQCLTDAERDADRGGNPGTADVAWAGQARDFAAKCAQRTEHGAAMLANMGTRDVVKDLDVLRAALGDAKLSYLGYSYGTQIGYSYAEAFPERVRALLLDGAIDPGENDPDSLVAQGEGFSRAFDQFATECARHDGCALGADPARARAMFEGLVQPLVTAPAKTGDGRVLSYRDAITGVVEAMYSSQSWAFLNTGLGLLRHGDGSILLRLADAYYERAADGKYSSLQAAYYAVRCVDNERVTDPAAVSSARSRMIAAAPFLGWGRPDQGELDVCASWPVPSTSRPHRPTVTSAAPPLVISTTNDPVTPYQAGVRLANLFRGGLLTVEGTQHTAFLHGNMCVDVAGLDYLVDNTQPAPGTRCRA
ncbi:alpha/beta hydrolase [Amycolatopsis endophytica]|uniref:Pimeloyl-ACP methyl ester carboxylesterase n=1 Tax=Amycolatopsis endophytica TaxID=860233 RepID=A0A853AXQ0_9PSEU|nr:alpha/beta hydrolase [Amycolatopsis endophytica]NYI87361.1 pimeloyl-ACP methyl ester carboxylesterase [Amycolatopsis endophytica]